jgi:uncharacterized integral membrane protein (TIGR00701 family)
MYEWAKVVHLLAVISWMAGLFYLPRLFVYHTDKELAGEADRTFLVMERRLLKAIMRPAAVVVLLSGFWLFHVLSLSWSEPWVLLKLLAVTLMFCFAESLEVENASTMRKQELMFAILKMLARRTWKSSAKVWSKCCRTVSASCGRPMRTICRVPTISISRRPDPPLLAEDRRYGRGPDPQPEGRRTLFALLKVNTINFEDPEKIRHKVHFDNLTPLYPNERFKMELGDPTGRIFRRGSSISSRRSARASAA